MNYLQHWATLLNSNQHDRLISDFESSVRGVRFLAKEHRDALVSLLTSVVQEAQGLSTNTCPKTNDREHSPTALIRLKMEIDSANSKIAQLKHRNEERRLTAIKYFRKMKEAEAKLQVDGNHQSCDSYDRTISELKYKLEACKKTQEETYSEANTYHHKWKCSERKVFTLEKQLKELNMTLQHFTFPTSNGALYDPIEEYSPTREDEQEDSIESPNDGSQYDYQPENQSMDTDYRYTSSQGSIQNMRNITISSSLLSKPTFGRLQHII